VPKSRGLTPKQAEFVQEYLIDLNATQAATRAKYSPKNACFIGAQLLRKPLVRAAIDAAQKKRAHKLEISAERVLLEVARLSFFDPRKLFHPDGTPKPVHELDDDTAAAIAGLDVSTTRTEDGESALVLKYKLAGKDGSLDKLMKHLGLYKADNEQAGEGLAAALLAGRERLAKLRK
jgi:phage terminase small subunit